MASPQVAVREERRRRIVERGSDRMALITGQINNLPPSPRTPTHQLPPRHSRPVSLSGFSTDYNPDNSAPSSPSYQPRHSRPVSLPSVLQSTDYQQDHSGGAEEKKDASSLSSRLKHSSGFKNPDINTLEFNFEAESDLTESSDTHFVEAYNHLPADDDAKIKPTSSTCEVQNAAADTVQLPKFSRRKDTFFSSRELNACIIASETTRALGALIIAVVVVFFHIISESVAATRPLCVVLVTDIMIVIAHLYLERGNASPKAQGGGAPKAEGGGVPKAEGGRVESHKDGENWAGAVKLLERGVVAYQAIRGVFIDCSIYLVVVVCGISLM